MTFWQHLWNRLRAVPSGVWAALGVAATILGLYLRGRRLQAELAKARLDASAAKSAAVAAQDMGKAMVHLDAAAKHREKADEIKRTLSRIENSSVQEQKRIQAMPASQVSDEYLRLIHSKKTGDGK